MGKWNGKTLQYLGLLSQVGFLMATPIIGSILFGAFLDRKFGTGVLFLGIFTVLGVGAAFRNLYVLMNKQDLARKKETGNDKKKED
ncbi:AtpZ/AtpI family protein [Anaerotalea alkaliphila]|uniref:AtpZ/AtpI family protein n=1 Tax=Anaerotalea alkaliphila TaxID=2662126 RepID=A0A7X5KLH9_9FIRM|nr:AtpZ/AtpI family protein [Anaerotalea alkaliphila]NDL66709.1 AtpZ/AtpI family protein [Anaerotalea alkaliphila]